MRMRRQRETTTCSQRAQRRSTRASAFKSPPSSPSLHATPDRSSLAHAPLQDAEELLHALHLILRGKGRRGGRGPERGPRLSHLGARDHIAGELDQESFDTEALPVKHRGIYDAYVTSMIFARHGGGRTSRDGYDTRARDRWRAATHVRACVCFARPAERNKTRTRPVSATMVSSNARSAS